DLKPRNILVGPDDHVYVADFGLARSLEDPAMTASGAILGSPAYMSPEQVKGEPVDHRSDIFSFGVILYELLTHSRPFPGESIFTIMEQRLRRKPTRMRVLNPEVPEYLERIVTRCLMVDRLKRYASLRELLADLDDDGRAQAAPSSIRWRRAA